MSDTPTSPSVLLILHPGFEELEAVGPIDLLRRAGVRVIIASTDDGIHVTGKNQVVMHADAILDVVSEHDYDAIVIPGGPGIQHIVDDPRLHAIFRRQAEAGKWIGAICAAPRVLQAAGVLQGKTFTAHHSVAEALPGLDADSAVVVDPPFITSRGAGTATEFALQLVEALVSAETRREIADSIHWQHD